MNAWYRHSHAYTHECSGAKKRGHIEIFDKWWNMRICQPFRRRSLGDGGTLIAEKEVREVSWAPGQR
jgi:hypothetical protein